jgi:hypothetical protein
VQLDGLYAASEGGRVMALAHLRAAPTPDHLPMIEESIVASLSAFEQYVAIEAAHELVDHLDAPRAERLRTALESVVESEEFYGTSRYSLANEILTELAQRLGDGDEVALA